jgi:PAS domain S-box-containing protein
MKRTDPLASLSAAHCRDLLAQTADAILVADGAGRLLDGNAAALTLLGYAHDELLRLNVGDIAALGPDWAAQEYDRFLEAGHWAGEVTLRTRAGALLPAESRAVVLSDGDSRLSVAFLRDLSERKRHVTDQARLAALVQSSADAIIGVSLAGAITDWNPAAERLYGYAANEVIGRSLAMLVPPERSHEIETLLTRLGQGEPIASFETVRRTKDGEVLEVSLTAAPVRDASGEIIASSSIVRDISAEKAAARALAASEARLRTAFENAPIGMALVHPDGQFLKGNHVLRQMLDSTEDELLGTTFQQITHPDDLVHDLAQLRRTLAGEISSYEMEKRYIRHDDRTIWVRLSTTLFRDESGAPLYFISQIEDITQRKEIEADLAATHQHTREVLERIDDNFYALDPRWRFTYFNDAAEQSFGYTRESLLGQNFWDTFPLVRETLLFDAFHEAMADGQSRTIEFQYAPNDRWYEVRAYPSANGLSVFFRDVTDRKQLDEELKAALEAAQAGMRAKESFLAMMSHELRTPLQAISGYADLLLADNNALLTPMQAEDIGVIRGAATRMMTLIDQLLDFSRLEAGRLELAAEPVALQPIIEQVRQDVAPQVAAKHLALRVELDPALPCVLGDAMAIRQILLNLVGNAVKFTERGAVSISATVTDANVAVAVRDSGIGIAAEALPHIFEEFHQVDGALNRRYPGAGLGLAIARRLAKQMGGSLSVTSRPGDGSVFTVSLPTPRIATVPPATEHPI